MADELTKLIGSECNDPANDCLGRWCIVGYGNKHSFIKNKIVHDENE